MPFKPRSTGMRPRLLIVVAALAAALPAVAQEGRPGPSGFPVPRYVSLRFDVVNARSGPGDDHRVLWVYRARGLPVQVIAETTDWRRICDPEGGVAWVHKRVTDGRRTAFRPQADALPLRARPDPNAEARATWRGRSLLPLDSCRDGWCRLGGSGGSGWAQTSQFWGAAPGRQCRSIEPPASTGSSGR